MASGIEVCDPGPSFQHNLLFRIEMGLRFRGDDDIYIDFNDNP